VACRARRRGQSAFARRAWPVGGAAPERGPLPHSRRSPDMRSLPPWGMACPVCGSPLRNSPPAPGAPPPRCPPCDPTTPDPVTIPFAQPAPNFRTSWGAAEALLHPDQPPLDTLTAAGVPRDFPDGTEEEAVLPPGPPSDLDFAPAGAFGPIPGQEALPAADAPLPGGAMPTTVAAPPPDARVHSGVLLGWGLVAAVLVAALAVQLWRAQQAPESAPEPATSVADKEPEPVSPPPLVVANQPDSAALALRIELDAARDQAQKADAPRLAARPWQEAEDLRQ